MKNNNYSDAINFAKILKEVDLGNKVNLGKFKFRGKEGVKNSIQYNQSDDIDLLENTHEYTFPLSKGDLQVSLQLYENMSYHYRLFCYTHFNGKSGMTFSMNLTTEKEGNNTIYLTQKLKFIEQYKTISKELAKDHRKQKQIAFSKLLINLGLDVNDKNELILGTYDPVKKEFGDTSAKQFLNDFIMVAILKGHFQGNKGYQLERLPAYNKLK